ncbi:MAG: hypothetical protein PWR01_1571 [Clostridiales bacterium]|jgi:hypothetical protein|nr:hypothetical protein [Clostridiales bacterium]
MKKLVKCLLVSLLIISTLGSGCKTVKEKKPDYSIQPASHNMNEINEFLLETGMPLDMVKALDEQLKTYIYETIDTTEKLTFSGHTEETITFPNTDAGDISLNTIPQLSLTVTAFKDSNGIYHVYPTFEWKIPNKVANDTFAFVLPEGWYLVPSKYNLRMWARENSNDAWEMIEDMSRPSFASLYGYGWNIPKYYYDGYGWQTPKYYARKAYVKGHAYFYAKPITPTPDKRICVSYADDTSSRLNLSYSLTYEASSITLHPASDDSVRFNSKLLEF